MTMRSSSGRWSLVEPLFQMPLDRFVREHHAARRPCVVHGSLARAGLSRLAELGPQQVLEHGDLTLVYSSGGNLDRRAARDLTLEQKRQLLEDGANFYYEAGLENVFPPVRAVAHALCVELFGGSLASRYTTAFLTSSRARTPWHVDYSGGVILQIYGSKRWTIAPWTESPAAPVTTWWPPSDRFAGPRAETIEFVLEPGSALYLPGTYWHSPQALDRPSLHIGFDDNRPTRLHVLLSHVIQQFLTDPAWACSLQPAIAGRVAHDDIQAISAALERIVPQLAGPSEFWIGSKQAASRFARTFIAYQERCLRDDQWEVEVRLGDEDLSLDCDGQTRSVLRKLADGAAEIDVYDLLAELDLFTVFPALELLQDHGLVAALAPEAPAGAIPLSALARACEPLIRSRIEQVYRSIL
jgi:50S ribosomal protein L16 3-hydroxylase